MGVADQVRKLGMSTQKSHKTSHRKYDKCILYQVPQEWMNKGIGELPEQSYDHA